MSHSLLKITEDGSHTLYVPEMDECYHSTHGAVQESMHIFIQNGFLQCVRDEIHVLEIGFGTGLNAFLTLLAAEKTNKKVDYVGIELFPVETEMALNLNYSDLIDAKRKNEFERIHTSEWNMQVNITDYFTLTKMQADVTKVKLNQQFDVIYFDAFSPEKQPEMWTEKIFDMLNSSMNEKSVLTTYCCKGTVKRAMKAANLTVEKLPGPIGKREILRARKNELQ